MARKFKPDEVDLIREIVRQEIAKEMHAIAKKEIAAAELEKVKPQKGSHGSFDIFESSEKIKVKPEFKQNPEAEK